MADYKSYLHSFISTGAFNLDDITYKLDKMYIEDKITEADRDELLELAANNASDAQQIDVLTKLKELEARVFALENPVEEESVSYPVWTSGYTTNKGEVVLFDYNGDGELDLLRYDGGRSYTSLKPGKIDGWHVVDGEGNILGTYYNGEFTPVGGEVTEQPAGE